MAVTRDDILRVAESASLQISEGEADLFRGQIESVLQHAGELAGLGPGDLSGVDAVVEKGLVRRSEELGPDLLLRPLAEFAQGWDEPFFSVPRLAALDQDELGSVESDADVEAG